MSVPRMVSVDDLLPESRSAKRVRVYQIYSIEEWRKETWVIPPRVFMTRASRSLGYVAADNKVQALHFAAEQFPDKELKLYYFHSSVERGSQ